MSLTNCMYNDGSGYDFTCTDGTCILMDKRCDLGNYFIIIIEIYHDRFIIHFKLNNVKFQWMTVQMGVMSLIVTS